MKGRQRIEGHHSSRTLRPDKDTERFLTGGQRGLYLIACRNSHRTLAVFPLVTKEDSGA